MVETTKEYSSYSEASVAACQWVNSGKQKVDTSKLKLYIGKLGDGKDKVVGVGYQTNAGVLVYLVRLDIDETKGIHFNAVKLENDRDKLAAVLKSTLTMTTAQRRTLYLDYLKGLEGRSAQFIWSWWSTGQAVLA